MEACSGGTMTSRNKIMFFTHKEHNRKGCFFITFLLYTPRCTLKRTMLLFFKLFIELLCVESLQKTNYS